MRRFFRKRFPELFRPRRKEELDLILGETFDRAERSPFWPPPEAPRGHSLIFGGRGAGKTTLLSELCTAAMRNGDPLIAVDMDGDLTPTLLAQVPPGRAGDVSWLRTRDPAAIPGFNVLDVSHGETTRSIVANLVRTARGLWERYWAPDVEDALRAGVRTLVAANRVLVCLNEPQFTLLDVKRLFELPDFCKVLLENYILDEDLIRWWSCFLERKSWVNRFDNMALIAPLDRLCGSTLAGILGQSESTVNLNERPEPGRIILFDLSALAVDCELRPWFGELLVDRINRNILAWDPVIWLPNGHSTILAINGNLKIPGIAKPGFLAELGERGATYILSNTYAPTVLADATQLFVFGCPEDEAEGWANELAGGVSSHDLQSLPSYAFYYRTYNNKQEAIVKRSRTVAPLVFELPGAKNLVKPPEPCGRNEADVKATRERFKCEWYEEGHLASTQTAGSRKTRA